MAKYIEIDKAIDIVSGYYMVDNDAERFLEDEMRENGVDCIDDWFEAEVTDKKKDCITVEVKVKADHVWDVRNAVLDRVLEIIDRLNDTKSLADKTPLGHHIHKTLANEIKQAVLALKGGEEWLNS